MATTTTEPVVTIPVDTPTKNSSQDLAAELLNELQDLRARIQSLEQSQSKITEKTANDGRDDNNNRDDSATSDAEDEELKHYPCDDTDDVIMNLRYVKWNEFKTMYAEEKPHVIDVLEGPAQYCWQQPERSIRRFDILALIRGEESEKKPEGDPRPKMDTGGAEDDLPERIRINSSLLASVLKDIVPRIDQSAPFVVLRPYKILVGYDEEIRERHRQLAAKWRTKSEHEELDDPTPLEPGKEPIDSRQAFSALECLVSFMDRHLRPVISRHRELLNYSTSSPPTIDPTISFSNLWYLFHPGMQVVCWFTPEQSAPHIQPTNRPSIWKVLQVSEGRPVLDSSYFGRVNPFIIRLYKFGYNGDRFGVLYRDFYLPHFSGERSIRSLGIVPTRFVNDYQTLHKKLLEQGKLFATFTTPQHRFYSGPTLSCHIDGASCPESFNRRTDYIKGNIIVDFKTARNEDQEWVPNLSVPDTMSGTGSEVSDSLYVRVVANRETKEHIRTSSDTIYDDDWVDAELTKDFIREDTFLDRQGSATEQQVTRKEVWSDDELIMMPDRACAWDLHRRRWALCDLEHMRPVPTDDGWKNLKLRPGHKRMLYAQVKRHFADRKSKEDGEGQQVDPDVVRGKGEGLIILLHGEPGVGKTSTAECMAAWLERPLYPITCGDLGTSAEVVEDKLNRISAQAEAWNCVLLLDEADVFLAARSKTELERNAIVSVFLRVLEYYKGLLFLTTNRVGSFDEAFVSRIHLALYYPGLNKSQNHAIWEMNLQKAKARKTSLSIDTTSILKWADANWEQNNKSSTRWNGRQIRNGCQTAIALAEFEAEETSTPVLLQVKHVQQVAAASKEFYDYVSRVLGADMAHRAFVERLRLDDWLPNMPGNRVLHNFSNYNQNIQAPGELTSSPRNRRRGGGRANDLISSPGGGGSPRTRQFSRHEDLDEFAFQSAQRHQMQMNPDPTGHGMSDIHGPPYDDEDDYADDFE
ncbi:hypothetical protein AbraIFM66951_010513 [Aspergillus brasiliensis]|uniref:AAA+ ATPase domain-containing protein n=1 Tax=Aspergillus brasiliensis TaxID=319629 RepID=A0A9W5YUW4_9EURO|nr:hypothetical protein AbraCBS73388_010628 [Aspergillus brasiliensis]GKZ47163.1 hypothetical protein AbraIFM66951_010513 [Aspergillus brasiliensis]